MLPVSMINLNSTLPQKQLGIKSPLGLEERPKMDSVHFGSNMSELGDFVAKYSKRIAADSVSANDVNLTFFGVRKVGEPLTEAFSKLAKPVKDLIAKAEGGELSYIHLGGEMGDQGIALQTMGLGHLLGEWKVLSPDTLMPFLPKAMKDQLAGAGMVKIVDNSNQLAKSV